MAKHESRALGGALGAQVRGRGSGPQSGVLGTQKRRLDHVQASSGAFGQWVVPSLRKGSTSSPGRINRV